jgi:hypothetical protein
VFGKDFQKFFLEEIQSKFILDVKHVKNDLSNFDLKKRMLKFLDFIGELWKMKILGDDLFKEMIDLIFDDFYIIYEVYTNHGKLMFERMEKEVESHFKRFNQLEVQCLGENKNHRFLKKINTLKKHKKEKFSNLK